MRHLVEPKAHCTISSLMPLNLIPMTFYSTGSSSK